MTQRTETILHQVIRSAPDLAPTSKERYLLDVDQWVAFASDNPNAWTRERAQLFYNGLLERLSAQSANRLMSSVTYASRWYAHNANNGALHFALVRKASVTNVETRHAITPEQAMSLLDTTLSDGDFHGGSHDAPHDLRDRAMIVVGLETGMRRMSLEGLRFENIKHAPYPRVEVPIKGHGDNLFSVPLSDLSLRVLNDWQTWLVSAKAHKTGAVFRRVWNELNKRGKPVSSTRDDESISGAMIQRIVSTRAKLADVGNVHPHLFRHSFVTWRTEMGASDTEIASVTGHSLKAKGGALAGYKDMMVIGGRARNMTPDWLLEWAAKL